MKSTCFPRPAFNALLKTLEEPPEHVKFLMATTEVDKVPVTVLSRCQRFDLRRIPAEKLATHFAEVSKAEGVEIEPEALGMIARAAEGSARDGLSILDQAIAHGAGGVSADQVRDMLGLADRGRIRRLLQLVLAGDARRRARRARRGARAGHRPDPAAARADGGAPFGDPGQGRSDQRRAAIGRGARNRAGDGRQAVVGNHPPAVADAAQGPAGRRRRARPARGRRDGAAEADPCRRSARSGRVDGAAERRGQRRGSGAGAGLERQRALGAAARPTFRR